MCSINYITLTINNAAFVHPTSIPDTSGKPRGACCPFLFPLPLPLLGIY